MHKPFYHCTEEQCCHTHSRTHACTHTHTHTHMCTHWRLLAIYLTGEHIEVTVHMYLQEYVVPEILFLASYILHNAVMETTQIEVNRNCKNQTKL